MALWRDCVLWLCIFITLVVTGTSFNHNCSSIVTNSSGYTIPNGDIIIEYGNPLEIFCVLNDDFVENNGPNSSLRLSFLRGNDPLPSEMIDVINSSTIKLHIDKPPVSQDWYTCVIDGKAAVCGSVVFVGTKPQNVSDFKCISSNYENLTCSWTIVPNYVKTSYKLTYTLGSGRLKNSYGCPLTPYPDDNGRMSCFWNLTTTPQYRPAHDLFIFSLTMNNTFGSNVMTIPFHNFENMYPAPPRNLRVVSNTSSSIYLQWRVPRALEHFPGGLHQRVLYQCEYGPKEWKLAGILCVHDECELDKKMSFNLTGLPHAHALCDIRVSLRSGSAAKQDLESMWSANASITVHVGSTVPGAPPQTTQGSFEIASAANNLEYMGAYVYWQQVPEEIRNGPHFNYSVSVVGEPHIHPVKLEKAYAQFINLPIGKNYKFRIWSKNAIGRSVNYSEVYIPRKFDLLKEPSGFTKTAYENGKYELNWQPPKDLIHKSEITNYTLFWCNHKKDRPYQCDGMLNWTIIPNNATSKEIYVIENDFYYQFAISANSETSTSGMLWADCTVIHSKHIGKMKNVQINGVGSTFIDVGWKLECSDQIGSVSGYVIYYCAVGSDPTRQHCEGPQQNVTFYGDQSLSHGNVTGLSPYTTYILTVTVLSKYNQESQQSDALRNTTLEAAPSTPLNVYVTNVTNSTMQIGWTPPNATNGVLKYYEIYFNNERRRINDPKTTTFTLTNLTSYLDYNVSVVACTVACSDPSPPIVAHTLVGSPGEIEELRLSMVNESHIQVKWGEPKIRGGKNDFYELSFKERTKTSNRTVRLYNVTGRTHTVDYCSGQQKHDTVYISVRAVNVIDGYRLEGPWSEELSTFCKGRTSWWLYMVIVFGAFCFIGLFYLGQRIYKKISVMKVVEIVLPPGLVADVTTLKNPEWNQKHAEPDHPPPADEELLLEKMGKTQPTESYEWSGCVQDHESVKSCAPYVMTGDVPKVPDGQYMPFSVSSTESSEKNTGYVVAGNYQESSFSGDCVSDQESVATCGPYVMTGDVPKVPNPGYVMTGDVVKGPSPGYVPFSVNATESVTTSE